MDEGRRGVEGLLVVYICLLRPLFHGSVCPSPGASALTHHLAQRKSKANCRGCVPNGLCRWGKREGGGI